MAEKAYTGATTPDHWPSMQEVYRSYIKNGYVMSDEGARKLSEKMQTAVASRLATTDVWIEDAELVVEEKFEEVFWDQNLYPRDAVMENRRERFGKKAEPVEEVAVEALRARAQKAPESVSLQALVDVCESHVNKAFREAGVVTPNEHDFIGELERQSRPRQNPSLDCLLRDMYTDVVLEDDPTLQTWLDTELGSFYFERAESRMPRAHKSAVADSALKRCADNFAVMAEDHASAGLVFAMLQEDGAQSITPEGVREVERLIDEVAYDHGFDMSDVPRIATRCRGMAQPEPGRASSARKGVPEKDRTARTPDDAERDARAKAAGASYASLPAKAQAR